jgi:hypothetical protein
MAARSFYDAGMIKRAVIRCRSGASGLVQLRNHGFKRLILDMVGVSLPTSVARSLAVQARRCLPNSAGGLNLVRASRRPQPRDIEVTEMRSGARHVLSRFLSNLTSQFEASRRGTQSPPRPPNPR